MHKNWYMKQLYISKSIYETSVRINEYMLMSNLFKDSGRIGHVSFGGKYLLVL